MVHLPETTILARDSAQSFEAWRAEVLAGGRYADDYAMRGLYEEGYHSSEAIGYLTEHKLFKKRAGRPRLVLNDDFVNRRIAAAIWKECARLLPRKLLPSARQIVVETQARVERIVFDKS